MSLRPGSAGAQKQSSVGLRGQNLCWREGQSRKPGPIRGRNDTSAFSKRRKCPKRTQERESTLNTEELGTLRALCALPWEWGPSWRGTRGRRSLRTAGQFSAMRVMMTPWAEWRLRHVHLGLICNGHSCWIISFMILVHICLQWLWKPWVSSSTVLTTSPDSQMGKIAPRGLTESEHLISLGI